LASVPDYHAILKDLQDAEAFAWARRVSAAFMAAHGRYPTFHELFRTHCSLPGDPAIAVEEGGWFRLFLTLSSEFGTPDRSAFSAFLTRLMMTTAGPAESATT